VTGRIDDVRSSRKTVATPAFAAALGGGAMHVGGLGGAQASSAVAELNQRAAEISLGAASHSLCTADIAAITTGTTVIAGDSALLPG
jgi:hypothetical protein